MRFRALLVAILSCAAVRPTVAAERPVVVELFTSQSCASCPPAEALIGRLARDADAVGAATLPLAFHVTYWNHLNWRDPYALPAATARQEAYAARLGGPTYTPQAVVDGQAGLVGSDEAGLRAAIAQARGAGPTVDVTLTRDGDRLAARIGAGSGSARAVLIGFDPSHTTQVLRGENAGRTIAQANVVRSIRDLGTWSGPAATFGAARPEGESAALLLQAPDGRILGAARLDAGSGTAPAREGRP